MITANVVNSDQTNAEMSPIDHRVVVFGTPDDPEQLHKLMMQLLDLDRVTAMQVIRALPGVIPQTLSQHTAADAAAEIRQLGLNAAAIPASDVPDLSHALQTHHLRITDETIATADSPEESPAWSWNEVAVISVGVVPSTAPGHYHSPPVLASGSSHHSWSDGLKTSAKHRPEAFVVLADGRVALRFASDEFNYEYLADRLSTSSGANFRQLVKDLVSHAGGAWVTPSTRAFLDRSPVPHYEFHSRDEFRRYTEFQTLLSSQFRDH